MCSYEQSRTAYPLLRWGWHPQRKAPRSANFAPRPPDLPEPPRLEVEVASFQGVHADEFSSYLLSWHLFEPRVLVESLPECSKDLIEARLVLLGHTPWRVAAGHLAPLEGFMTSAILTAWCRLRSTLCGSAVRVAGAFEPYVS